MFTIIQTKIYTLLLSVLAVDKEYILPVNSNRSEPESGLFFVYDINPQPIGEPSKSDPDDTGATTMYQLYRVELTLNAYRDGARDAIYNFINNLKTETNKTLLRSLAISENGKAAFLNLSFLEDTNYKEREQIVMSFNIVAEKTDNVGYIENINLDLTAGVFDVPIEA